MKSNRTNQDQYSELLLGSDKLWKQILSVQYPYRRTVEKLGLGETLEIGCGVGRVLGWLSKKSIGVDHNSKSIHICTSKNLTAYTSEQFQEAAKSGEIEGKRFENLLLAHVLEHLEPLEQIEIIETYLPYLRRTGGIFIVTPQEKGYSSDATHITFTDFDRIREILNKLNFEVLSQKSFPFPRVIGKYFKYNEFQIYARLKS